MKLLCFFSLLFVYSASCAQEYKNVFSVSPIGLNTTGITFGASYERYLKPDFSLIAPVTFTLRQINSNGLGTNPFYTFINPGFVFYPTNGKKKEKRLKYGIGSNVVIGFGNRNYDESFFPGSGLIVHHKEWNTQLGLVINNYWELTQTGRFKVSVNAGVGLLWIDSRVFAAAIRQSSETIHFGLNFGLKR